MPIKVDGVEQPGWTSLPVKAGQTLAFGYFKSGARDYIAISGGVDVPLAWVPRDLCDRRARRVRGPAFNAGDKLAIGAGDAARRTGRGVARSGAGARKDGRTARPSRPLLAPATDEAGGSSSRTPGRSRPRRTASAIDSAAAVRSHSFPRTQPFGAGSDPSNIVDSCYPYGSIQVPGGTEPIVLHRDAVSGGGYFMLGTVISADMDLIGQLQPHQPARFIKVDMETALKARADENARLDRLKQSLT